MKKLRGQLMATQAWLEARLKGQRLPKPEGLLSQNEQLWEPLYACYKSLQACGWASSPTANCSTPCAA
jgi:phosphoenolpyruvate carboxylase